MHLSFSFFILLLCIFLTFYYFSEYLHSNIRHKIKYYINELLYALKIKERPKKESFIGMIKSLLKMVLLIPKLVLNVDDIILFMINSVIGSVEIISGTSLALILGMESLFKGMTQMSTFILYVLEFILTHLLCFIKILFQAPSCIIWYVIEIIGKIIYIMPTIVFSILDIIGLNGSAIEKTIWSWLEALDDIVYNFIGFNIIHFPFSIRDKCYNCRRLKMNVVGEQFTKTFDILAREFPEDASPGVTMMKGGGKRLMSALQGFIKAM